MSNINKDCVLITKNDLLELLICKEMFDRLESGDVSNWEYYNDVVKGNHIGNGILEISEVKKKIASYINNMKSSDIFYEYMIDRCFHND
ncbi:MAG: hypothetical protein KC589_07490 [Nanoarchaeota archaeon]|nr:hypothetical protein [Nanoarchaeota archaeon]